MSLCFLIFINFEGRQAQLWMAKAGWNHPLEDLQCIMPADSSEAQEIAKSLHEAIPWAFPKPVDWNKIKACTQGLTNLCMTITTDLKLFLRKILDLERSRTLWGLPRTGLPPYPLL